MARRWPERGAEAASFVLPLAVYLATLAPTVTLEDSGEFITVAYTLGVAHPPGYPLWTLVAHAFTWLPWASVAERVHLCSAVFAAATCWLLFRLAREATGHVVAALLGALALGVSHALWSQAVVAEVYTLNAFLTLAAFHLALRFSRAPGRRVLGALALVVGIGLTNHHLLALAALPLALWALARAPRVVLQPRTLALCAGALLAGLSLYAYLPLRARADPPVNWDQPTTLAKTLAHVRRDLYRESGRASGDARDVLRHTADALSQTAQAFGWPLALLALVGLASGVLPRGLRAASLALFVLGTLGLNALLRDRFLPLWSFDHRVYYIPAHLMVALWVAAGVALLARRLRRPWGPALAAAAVAGCALAGWRLNDRSGDELARRFGLDFLAGVPRGAGLVPLNDVVLFPVLYLRYVEGVRPDVSILSPSFGWDGRSVAALVSDTPVTERWRRALPHLAGYRSVPSGLGYLLVPDGEAPLGPPRVAQAPQRPPEPPGPRYEPFEAEVRASYAAAYVRHGEWLASQGERDGAEQALTTAATLGPADPYVLYLLARARQTTGLGAERAPGLLERALAAYDASYEESAMSLYPVTREELSAALAQARAAPAR